MIEHESSFRVRYAETDRMGYLYYGNYAAYFEVGRVELLRSLGLSYRELEDRGVILPVRDFEVRYRRPALYDEALRLLTRLDEVGPLRLVFSYELRRADDSTLLTTARCTLISVDRESGRPKALPDDVSKILGAT